MTLHSSPSVSGAYFSKAGVLGGKLVQVNQATTKGDCVCVSRNSCVSYIYNQHFLVSI